MKNRIVLVLFASLLVSTSSFAKGECAKEVNDVYEQAYVYGAASLQHGLLEKSIKIYEGNPHFAKLKQEMTERVEVLKQEKQEKFSRSEASVRKLRVCIDSH